MSDNQTKEPKIKGGSFVIDNPDMQRILTPEDFTEEHRMIGETVRDFIDGEVVPHDEELEKLNYEMTVDLLRKAGELGLLGADVPEPFGGIGLDKVSSTIINEALAKGSSFAPPSGLMSGSVHCRSCSSAPPSRNRSTCRIYRPALKSPLIA